MSSYPRISRTFLTLSFLGGLLILAPRSGGAQAAGQVVANPASDTVAAGRFDMGKMWTFEYPPTQYLRDTYGFSPDSAWYARARLGALRIPGCSASLVSARGLVMTNHHCGRDGATEVKRAGENILDNGFYARTDRDERRAESMYADQLIAIVDVTAELSAASSAAAREQVSESVRERLTTLHGGKDIEVEVTDLWDGARTSAYVFRRFHDVRLVMTPELQIGYFGGDPDNFTYPRYALDYTFFRIYDEAGAPLATPNYFPWSQEGVKEGDLIFVIGNPGSTSRLQTVAELEFRRDVSDNALVHLLADRVDVYQDYISTHPDTPETTRNKLFEFLNAEKAYSGMVSGLRDPYIMARRAAGERSFLDSLRAKPALEAEFGSIISQMADLQNRKRAISGEVKAFTALGHPTLDATVLLRGIYAAQLLNARAGGAPAAMLEGIQTTLGALPNQPSELQEGLLAGRLRDLVWAFGNGSSQVQRVLDGRSPEVMAALVNASPLADSASTNKAIADGSLTAEDPAIRLATTLLQLAGGYSQQMAQLSAQEEDLARGLGRAVFAVYGTNIPPDATFSPRIADGLVKSYDYNGTVAPVYTTFHGLFDRHFSHNASDWALPPRWLERASRLNMATPVNFISTADIIGGNSGSPVLDRNLRVVGLIFDGNIESLHGDYIYLAERSRAVAVDVRGILESLRSIYQADRLVRELTTGR